MTYTGTKRRVFISHHQSDNKEVNEFIDTFANEHKVFTPYVLGANSNYDMIDSSNPAYVMSQIRKNYLKDSSVTIVLIGSCTHSRRYVDWEIKSSLRQSDTELPNGLIGILLPSMEKSGHLPERLRDNWNTEHKDCFARYYAYPTSMDRLGAWIDDAYNARTTRAKFIANSQDMMKYNGKCKVCGVTH
ncbi:TIR domain-containing protein [Alcaligenes nematophilus]